MLSPFNGESNGNEMEREMGNWDINDYVYQLWLLNLKVPQQQPRRRALLSTRLRETGLGFGTQGVWFRVDDSGCRA